MTPEYDVIEGSLSIERIRREIRTFCMQQKIDMSFINNAELRVLEEHVARQFVMQFMAKVASKKYDVKTVRFPATWWDSFKRKYFPYWAQRKWPVRYEEVTLEAHAYHPDVAIPNYATFVDIMMNIH